mgnify:FL=1
MGRTPIHSLEGICTAQRHVNLQTLEHVIVLAIEIAREGREGKKIGTIFVVGDSENVLRNSRCLILDPLWHHPLEMKHIENSDVRETVKELAQLDGAFVVDNSGIFLSACRYLNASAEGIAQPLGLGSRHMAAASITKQTDAVAVVVSESAIVRVFDDGEVVGEIIPELWMLKNYSLHLTGPYSTRTEDQVTVVSKDQ